MKVDPILATLHSYQDSEGVKSQTGVFLLEPKRRSVDASPCIKRNRAHHAPTVHSRLHALLATQSAANFSMSLVASLRRPSSENGAAASRAARVSKPAHAPSSPSSASTPGFFDDDLVNEVSAAASDAAAAAVSETLGPTCRAASSAACTYRLARSLGRDDGGGDAGPRLRALGVSATGDGSTASIGASGGASSRAGRSSSESARCCSPGVSGG
mmetsp:Transcript_4363/g.18056  ORF Transcript_4363/g.18056 Transcript_4363/m.18056 type:complete len:214 (+) Transcript_4363:28-669(+)